MKKKDLMKKKRIWNKILGDPRHCKWFWNGLCASPHTCKRIKGIDDFPLCIMKICDYYEDYEEEKS